MKIEASYGGISGSQETIYNLLLDPEVLSKCIPGCKELQRIEQDRYLCNLTFGYGGIVQVEKISPPSQLKLTLDGKGNAGTVKATGIVELEPEGEERTLIKYSGEFYLGGPAALLQMGAHLFGGLPYKELLNSFFQNLEAELAARTNRVNPAL